MSAQTDAERELAELLVESLNLEGVDARRDRSGSAAVQHRAGPGFDRCAGTGAGDQQALRLPAALGQRRKPPASSRRCAHCPRMSSSTRPPEPGFAARAIAAVRPQRRRRPAAGAGAGLPAAVAPGRRPPRRRPLGGAGAGRHRADRAVAAVAGAARVGVGAAGGARRRAGLRWRSARLRAGAVAAGAGGDPRPRSAWTFAPHAARSVPLITRMVAGLDGIPAAELAPRPAALHAQPDAVHGRRCWRCWRWSTCCWRCVAVPGGLLAMLGVAAAADGQPRAMGVVRERVQRRR